jgi:radical SAM superfamily enzyme YgiQ (UPF0313 family)
MIYHGVILTDVMARLRFRPMGAYRVANVLREAGYNILVIDMYSTLSIEELKILLDKTITKETLFFGYSSTFFYASDRSDRLVTKHPMELAFPTSREYFIDTNHYVKSLNPNIKIMYGGASVSHYINTTQSDERDFAVDYIIDGYSETMVVDVVNNIRDNLPQRPSKLIKTAEYINYDREAKGFDFRNHHHAWHESDCIAPGEALPLEVARGCVFKCKFCSFPLLGKKKNDMSYLRTEECLLREIQENYEKYQTRQYMIVDDTFNERTDKMETLLRVRDKSKIDLEFGAYIRLDLVSKKPEQIPLIRDLNLVFHCYGIESFTYEAAASIGKGGDPKQMLETMHEIYHQMNGKVAMDAGHIIGLPHETPETLERSVQMMVDSPADTIYFFALTLARSAYGKSELWENAPKYGYTLIDDPHIPGKQTWKNDVWDFETCVQIASQLEKKYVDSGRNRLGGAGGFGMLNLGYDFLEAAKMTLRDFRSPAIIHETTNRHLAQRASYFDMLNQYIDNN